MKVYSPPSPLFSVRVKVPATSANLGAGFDALGLALGYHNELEVTAWDDPLMPPATVQVDGEGAGELPLDRTNLVIVAAREALERIGRAVPALRIKLVNRIPLARGLGSSSAAIVGGIAGVNAGLGHPLSMAEMVDLAVAMEGHPDNVVPAFAGGFCVSVSDGKRAHYSSFTERRLFQGLRAVVCVPYFKLETRSARDLLPASVSRADAVFNSSRAAFFVGALLERRHDRLGVAMEDRLHQPYRRKLVPGLDEVIAGAKEAGAWGAALSGAGPSVIALCPAKAARRAGEAMTAVFRRHGVSSLWMDLETGARGVQAARLPSRPARRSAPTELKRVTIR